MAMVYDFLLLLAILFCYSMLYAFITVVISSEIGNDIQHVSNNDVIHELEPIPLGWPYLVGVFALYAAFYIYFWYRPRQTLGMKAWKLSVVNVNAEPVSLAQCVRRFFAAIISVGVFGLGYFIILIDPEKRSWHDRLSNTRIVREKTD